MQILTFLIIVISFNLFATDNDLFSPENIMKSLKASPKSMLQLYKEGCNEGNQNLCLPEKCINGDKKACIKFSAAVKQGFKKTKNSKVKQVDKISIFPAASKAELQKLNLLSNKCNKSKKREDCDAHMKLFKQLSANSLKESCDAGRKSSCMALSEIKQDEIRRVERKREQDIREQKQIELSRKIQMFINNKDVNGLKTLCLNGEKYACRFIDRVQSSIDNERALTKTSVTNQKLNEIRVEKVLGILKSIKQDGVTVEKIVHTRSQITLKGHYTSFKAIGSFLKKYKDARIRNLGISKRNKAWLPIFEKDKENPKSKFIIKIKS